MNSPSIICRSGDRDEALHSLGSTAIAISPNKADLHGIYHALEVRLRAADYKGWDPFDGLNSQVFNALGMNRSALLRLIWIQLFKRSPVNFRRLAAVPPTQNPKAIALMSMAYAKMGDTSRQRELIQRLLATQLPSGGWGYPFDWQARAFYVPTGTPNVICTAYAVQALCEHTRATGADHRDPIGRAADFIAAQLVRRNDGQAYIAYIPTTDALVHNASLWGAYVLAAAIGLSASHERSLVQEVVRNSTSAQGKDGSWVYGNRSHHQFVDSFHTGFNLHALRLIDGLIPELELAGPIDKGLEYYVANFFEEDGRPKYYNSSAWPADCHCTAQACVTLLHETSPMAHRELATKVLFWTIKNMWRSNQGYFRYQRHRFYTNSIDYIRWTQAWMFLAIAHSLTSSNEPDSPGIHVGHLPKE